MANVLGLECQGVTFCTGVTWPAGYGILGNGTYGLCTPIGDIGDLGTGDGGIGVETVPLAI